MLALTHTRLIAPRLFGLQGGWGGYVLLIISPNHVIEEYVLLFLGKSISLHVYVLENIFIVFIFEHIKWTQNPGKPVGDCGTRKLSPASPRR